MPVLEAELNEMLEDVKYHAYFVYNFMIEEKKAESLDLHYSCCLAGHL